MSQLNVEEKICEIRGSILQHYPFGEEDCDRIEDHIERTIRLGENGEYKRHTVDVVPLRKKYFFGEGYTYGSQLSRKGPGMERLFPKDYVDPIPAWIFCYVINPLVGANVIPANFVNSVTINDYSPGGCIVSHIDPPHLFDRPIVSLNLYSDSALCFGCKFAFKPIRCSEPIYKLSLPRGVVTLLSGYSANEVTHCIRPEDTKRRRVVILLRRVLPDAPRLQEHELDPVLTKSTTDDTKKTGNNHPFSRERKSYVSASEKILRLPRAQFKKSSKREKRPTDLLGKPNIDKGVFFADNVCYVRNPYSHKFFQ